MIAGAVALYPDPPCYSLQTSSGTHMESDHHHHHGPLSDQRLAWAIAINVLLTVVQVAAGVVSGSLGLVADALHNLSDAASMGIALLASRIARRPADRLMTFGYQRAELVATLINVTALLLVGGYLLVEAISRFVSPTPVQGWPVVIVAGVALVIDILTALIIYRGARHSLNIRAAFVHNVTDALASLGVIVAGTLILLYDLIVADLLVTVAISGYVIYQAMGLLPRTVRLLMGAMPDDLEYDAIVAALRATPACATSTTCTCGIWTSTAARWRRTWCRRRMTWPPSSSSSTGYARCCASASTWTTPRSSRASPTAPARPSCACSRRIVTRRRQAATRPVAHIKRNNCT